MTDKEFSRSLQGIRTIENWRLEVARILANPPSKESAHRYLSDSRRRAKTPTHLTEEDRESLREEVRSGLCDQATAARKYGVCKATVSRLMNEGHPPDRT